ncbi:MAG: glutaredoxin 3 [Gammaproteobacteria bacterium]|nr:MAG: glutaredoxin 3 [Gammaproteobacteria bacterium]
MNPKIVMYSTPYCPFCVRAKQLLEEKQLDFRNIDVQQSPKLRKKMQQMSGRTSVPQIWCGDVHIGGWTDLAALERSGEFDRMLEAGA